MAGLSPLPLSTHPALAHPAPQPPQRLLSQAVFQQALLRQLKQADRFEEKFGLALISFAPPHLADRVWAPFIEALSPALRGTDIVGWFEEGAAIGVIRSGADIDDLETSASLAATLEKEISARLGSAGRKQLKVEAEVYLPGGGSGPMALRDVVDHAVARSIHPAWRWAKRILDVASGTALLALSSPVMLAVAALVKWTSDGDVLVKQERIGQFGRPFTMLKFRTMHSGAGQEIHERFVAEFIQGGQAPQLASGRPQFKLVADPRVTKVGQFLRRSSLDELPQLWNVVKGEMSLVGPRPPLAYEVKCYKPWHRRRVLEAKPGLTGLWQVKGRSRTTFDEMVRLDLRYARNQSFWTDLKILAATPRAVVSGEGAR